MTIISLIAADALSESIVDKAREALGGELRWIERGSAAEIATSIALFDVKDRIGSIKGVDVIIHGAERTRPRLFVADMDSTMIGQECIDELADYAGFKAEVAEITERAMQGELDFAGALAERVALLRGLPVGTLRQCLEERVRPNAGAETLVRTLGAKGCATLLVTGGFTSFAEPVGEGLGFASIVANRLEHEDGVLTGRTVGPIVDSKRKRAELIERRDRMGLAVGEVVAIGDGANDRLMVEEADLGLAYRPKPALAAVADGILLYNSLDALLWAFGWPRDEWVSA